ncbi:MAG TPA: XdhC/CoxI family protein [Thermomicrobiales bacterium]|nr:XdhC/CoxI family protein [Thermomicrobiales bacterium]
MNAETFKALEEAIHADSPAVVATVIAGPALGSELLYVHPDHWLGSLGDADTPEVRDQMRAMIRDGGTAQVEQGDNRLFVEAHLPPPHLVIIGGVHIAMPLVTYANTLGYQTTIIDARGQFLTEERFPHAGRLIDAWPDEGLAQLNLHPGVAAVCLAHDPKFEDPAMEALLKSDVGYIGAMGSRKTSAERRERLKLAGFSDEQLDRIYGPVGLNIGAQSPEEVALAIMAEIVAVRRGKSPRQANVMAGAKSTA